MQFETLKPKTKEELLHLMKLLTEVTTYTQAEELYPQDLLQLYPRESQVDTVLFRKTSNDIKRYLSEIKSIKLYLAFDPSKHFVEKILHYFDDLNPHMYVEIVVDETLIGGVRLAMNGQLYDESLDTLIDKKLSLISKSAYAPTV